MSSTISIIFSKGEIVKVKEWFSRVCPVNRFPDLPIPEINGIEEVKHDVNDRGIYVEFSKNRMQFDMAIWDDLSKCFAVVLSQELINKYKVKNVIEESIGRVELEDFMTWTGLVSKLYKNNTIFNKNNWREKVEGFLREKAKGLVNE